jgi:hypothetical protein
LDEQVHIQAFRETLEVPLWPWTSRDSSNIWNNSDPNDLTGSKAEDET